MSEATAQGGGSEKMQRSTGRRGRGRGAVRCGVYGGGDTVQPQETQQYGGQCQQQPQPQEQKELQFGVEALSVEEAFPPLPSAGASIGSAQRAWVDVSKPQKSASTIPGPDRGVHTNDTLEVRGRGRGRGRGKAGTGVQAPPDTPGSQRVWSGAMPRDPSPIYRHVEEGDEPSTRTTGLATLKAADRERLGLMSQKGKNMTNKLKALPEFPIARRPDKGGTVGRRINLLTNHFSIKINTDNMKVYHYDMKIVAISNDGRPEEGRIPTDIKRKIFEVYVKQQSQFFTQNQPAFDGQVNMYVKRELPFTGEHTHVMDFEEQGRDMRRFKILLQKAANVDFSPIQDFIEGKRVDIDIMRRPLQALDVILRHTPSTTVYSIGRSFYTGAKANVAQLGRTKEIWFGRFVSIRPTWQMTLNIDVSATAFVKAQPCLDLLRDVIRERFDSDMSKIRLNDRQILWFRNEVKNLVVAVEFGSTKRKYRVVGVTKVPADAQRFIYDDEKGKKISITVAEYFRREKETQLRYPNLPCLQVGSKDRSVYYPLELCSIREGQRFVRKLNDYDLREMVKQTAIPAPRRKGYIEEEAKMANFNKDQCLQNFAVRINNQMEKVGGRVLPAPAIQYKDGKVQIKENAGAWDIRGNKFCEGKTVKNWAVVKCSSRDPKEDVSQGEVEKFVNRLGDNGRKVGLTFEVYPAQWMECRGENDVEDIFAELNKKKPELVLVVLCGKGYYPEVKRVCDVKLGMVTQCVLSKNVKNERGMDQLCTNLCLKINAKLGGVNNTSELAQSSQLLFSPSKLVLANNEKLLPGFHARCPIMLLGADVTHPAPSELRKPSVAAVVGSKNKSGTKYNTEVSVQSHRVEMIEELDKIVETLLLQYYQNNRGVKPLRIIFYRDGVSEGQFKDVLRYELAMIQKACTRLEADYKPPITFIVVQKRHHTRFFCENPRDAVGKSANVPPGTVVDTKVVHPHDFDFYLLSHFGIQGTSRPTHYYVIWDDSKFTSDEIQAMTYQLCHNYSRATRSVSLPAPVYYAHLAAFRARTHLKEADDDSDAGSTISGNSGGLPTVSLPDMNRKVQVHENLKKDSIYYA